MFLNPQIWLQYFTALAWTLPQSANWDIPPDMVAHRQYIDSIDKSTVFMVLLLA